MEQKIQRIVEEVLKQLEAKPKEETRIPIGVSARHCHLSESNLATLFGKGYQLTKKADLSQPGQFAANETVMIAGPKGSIDRVRILGPLRKETQVEVSQTDAIKLGLKPPIRESGNLEGSSPVTIIGPAGSLFLKKGLILAHAHIHMPPETASLLDVTDGEYVSVETDHPIRPLRFENVQIRVSSKYILEMHIDTDEANAGFIVSGQTGRLVKRDKKR